MGEITQGKEQVENLVKRVYEDAANGMAKQILKIGIGETDQHYYNFYY